MNWYDIPGKLVINADQTGVYVILSNNKTYENKGAKQVDITGKDEKHTYTLMVATSCAGDILPMQQVWSGKTLGSLPLKTSPMYNDVIECGFQFAFASSVKQTSHFLTLKNMKEWMEKIYALYVKQIIADDPSLQVDPKPAGGSQPEVNSEARLLPCPYL
ncbi:hypothetical protein JAAARDRAFT_196138 [Jaapia argillacea MUCL 33604]|uniref:Uncharacterized protein n=1 Tax=Jaapia argillacea MUCL 33604 TaxID=933084 RepID=A0A067PWK3_9AGAM|nr:hypothetical protein JAAARDRAFT_196138 [Jaapia argillacea MUCL 33604]